MQELVIRIQHLLLSRCRDIKHAYITNAMQARTWTTRNSNTGRRNSEDKAAAWLTFILRFGSDLM